MRAMGVAVASAAALMISGAASAQETWNWVFQQASQQQAACHDRYEKGTLKTATAEMKCADNGVYDALARAGYPDLDLVRVMVARHLLIAEQFDRRKITRAEANDKLAELSKEITTELQRRDTMRQQAKAAAESADAAARSQELQERALQQRQAQAAQRADEARRQREFQWGLQLLQPHSYGPPAPAPTNTTCQWLGPQLQCHTQ